MIAAGYGLFTAPLVVLALLAAGDHNATVDVERVTSIPQNRSGAPVDEHVRSTTRPPFIAQNNRIILSPAQWKILRNTETPTRVLYTFKFDANEDDWNTIPFDFPMCAVYACEGLLEYWQTCEDLCANHSLVRERLRVVSSEYAETARSLEARLFDLRSVSLRATTANSLDDTDGCFSGDRSAKRIDVLQPYAAAISKIAQTLNVTRTLNFGSRVSAASPQRFAVANEIRDRVGDWAAEAHFVTERVTSALYELHKAELHVQLCTQSALGLDMSGCESHSLSPGGYYTDTPTRVLGAYDHSCVETVREAWDPVTLSRWYMAFTTVYHGNTHVCWLTRGMLGDHANDYAVPQCDSRGLCQPLVVDNDTYTACNDAALPVNCPVLCDVPCFGPLCYDAESGGFRIQTALRSFRSVEARTGIINRASPRRVRAPYAVYAYDIAEFKNRIDAIVDNASFARKWGERVLYDAANMRRLVDEYATAAADDVGVQQLGWKKARERCAHVNAMATASIVLSTTAVPVLFVVLLYSRW